MIRGAFAVTIVAGALAVTIGCSGRSIVIGGDPNEQGGAPLTGGATTGGGVTGGAFPNGGVTGGAFASGGSGFAATGGTAGAVISTGGTSGVNGGTSTLGGTSGIAEGGEGGILDAYPRVYWEGGLGYRSACPQWGDVWGFTCWGAGSGADWNSDSRSLGECTQVEDTSYCDACSCIVPCETSEDCPRALSGQRAACFSTHTGNSCLVLCEQRTHCPTGMECVAYSGGEHVCVWWTGRVD